LLLLSLVSTVLYLRQGQEIVIFGDTIPSTQSLTESRVISIAQAMCTNFYICFWILWRFFIYYRVSKISKVCLASFL